MAQYEIATGYLNGLLQEWDSARKPQELTMLECYQDDMRIPRAGDTTGTGISKTQSSKPLFMGVTRSKIRSAVAKINDMLFGNGRMPFDISAENPELEPYADTIKTIINGQLEAMDYRDLLGSKVYATARYGTGWTFGPFVRKAKKTHTAVDNSAGFSQIVQMEHEYDEPYFELGNTLDCYPDPSARTMRAAQGIFWVSMFSPAQVLALKSDASYVNIDEAATIPDQSGTNNGSDIAQQLRGNLDYWYKDGRIKFVRYFGRIPANKIDRVIETGTEQDMVSIDSVYAGNSPDMVPVIVIMAGGYAVKITKLEDSDNPVAFRQCWENALDEMWGIGIAENNFAMQRVTNAAFRMFAESKGLALNPAFAVDRSKFLPSEDFKRYPGKVYQFKPGLSPDEKESAIIQLKVPDVSDGWMDLINMAGQFSDDDTGITKYTQGDDSSHLNKTASGISMIMSASSLPLKEVVEHCDQTIEAHIEALIDWNLTFMEPETVAILYGKEHAQRWEQIKQIGKVSFIDFKATGTSSFMAKEVLTSKLQAFLSMAMSNPAMAQLVDVPEMMKQVWEAMEVGRKLPIIEKDKDGQDLPQEVIQQMQEMQQMIQQLDDVIQKQAAELESKQAKDQTEQQKAANEAMRLANDRYQKETDRMQLEYEMKRNDLSESEKVQFDADWEKTKMDMQQDHEILMVAFKDAMSKGMVPIQMEQTTSIMALEDVNQDMAEDSGIDNEMESGEIMYD